MKCPAAIIVHVNHEKTKLVITKNVSEHNHELSKEIFQLYPEQRRLDEETTEMVKRMLEEGVKCKTIRDHILQQVGWIDMSFRYSKGSSFRIEHNVFTQILTLTLILCFWDNEPHQG